MWLMSIKVAFLNGEKKKENLPEAQEVEVEHEIEDVKF